MDIDGARCQRVDRAETGGAQGEDATVVKHDDGGGIRAVPPFVEAYAKITRPLGRLIVDSRFMTLADIAGWLLLSWDTVKTVVQRRLEKERGLFLLRVVMYREGGFCHPHAILTFDRFHVIKLMNEGLGDLRRE